MAVIILPVQSELPVVFFRPKAICNTHSWLAGKSCILANVNKRKKTSNPFV